MESYFSNLDSKMTQARYFEMKEQLGQEPIEAEIPPDWTDFPFCVQEAVVIYDTLGDRVIADVGFLGKDYSGLQALIDIHQVDDTLLMMEIITWLERRSIKASTAARKKTTDKIKSKSRPK